MCLACDCVCYINLSTVSHDGHMPSQLVDGMGGHSYHFLELYPLFVKAMSDEEDEVCSNAIYGLGLLAANAGPKIRE